MSGYGTLRETWNAQWGPAPVLALYGTEERKPPVTLPGRGFGARRTRKGAAA